MIRIDEADIERKARAAEAEAPGAPYDGSTGWFDEAMLPVTVAEHICANSPPVTLALLARIHELEAAYRELVDEVDGEVIGGHLLILDARLILEKGTVIP